MNIALFGGTFDPIHRGHLTAARAARDCFALECIYFIPAGRPPHRPQDRLTAFEHRYAMVALACAGEPCFLASLAESPAYRGISYSIHTVRRFRRQLRRGDKLFFIIGADAFLELRSWRHWRALLDAVNFVIISRPGFHLDQVAQVIPADQLRLRRSVPGPWWVEEFQMRHTSAWVMGGVWAAVSATDVRRRAREHRRLGHWVPPAVADYINKHRLYE